MRDPASRFSNPCGQILGAVRFLRSLGLVLTILVSIRGIEPVFAQENRTENASRKALDFFESRVRPILVERCQRCHGSERVRAGLRLDHRDAILRGGDSGPAVVPGDLNESVLIEAIRYDGFVQMPPDGKLPSDQIADLERWVLDGAAWPESVSSEELVENTGGTVDEFDLEGRAKRLWSFQPLAEEPTPDLPSDDWSSTFVDAWVLTRLREEGLEPAVEADRATLLRRLSFDLIGLPPEPEEVAGFLNDERPDAVERQIDRFLASPRYGERWARHWLDLVRYAETSGHEFDYDIPQAFRYRDYVIQAWNADLPYDRLIREHLAGDLLADPRFDPVEGIDQSAIATGFYYLSQGTHSPVDVAEEEVHRIENQIDVVSKTFLGLTVACARCHDHKFDPITTRDYYALSGQFKSGRPTLRIIDNPSSRREALTAIALRRDAYRIALAETLMREPIAERFLDAYRSAGTAIAAETGCRNDLLTADLDADHVIRGRWIEAVEGASEDVEDPLYPFVNGRRLVDGAAPERTGDLVLATFDEGNWEGWFVHGEAFGDRPTLGGEIWIASDSNAILAAGLAHSGLLGSDLRGVVRSPSFVIDRDYLHLRMAGSGGHLQLVVDGFEKIRAPIYGGLTHRIDHGEELRWIRLDVKAWRGHRAYLEVSDGASMDFTSVRTQIMDGSGYVVLDRVVSSDHPEPPRSPRQRVIGSANTSSPKSLDVRAIKLQQVVRKAANRLKADEPLNDRVVRLLDHLVSKGLVASNRSLLDAKADYLRSVQDLSEPRIALTIAEANPWNDRVHIRGRHQTLGAPVPRRFLEAFEPESDDGSHAGLDRLRLADRIADPTQPLTSRVLVNRLWHHLFGRGLVATPDDFGNMGRPPTHPELLDALARHFIDNGWSIKRVQRVLTRSQTYRMASAIADVRAESIDPDNRLRHRQTIRRLEAEAIRDAILSVSGRLENKMYGPSVPVHLTSHMQGRGRPSRSGPLDGAGRRSLYLEVRRNFLNPLFLAFDFPTPATTQGRRTVSNVPAQALSLLNDTFVLEQSALWARRLVLEVPRIDERIERLYREGLGRAPTDRERQRIRAFLESVEADDAQAKVRGWSDLSHILINTKEFLYIR